MAQTQPSKKFYLDLHLHSKYSRATSPRMDLEGIVSGCQTKGIQVAACADFTHPFWFKELEIKLELQSNGLYRLKNSETEIFFILSTEIAAIYSKAGRVRRIHNIVIVPTLEEARELNRQLAKIGNLSADGRPILGLDSAKLAKILFGISREALLIPAHIWTPWFSLFGSKSGFDKIEECFEDYTDKIFALETGLSSDPLMNWQLSSLDKFTLVSNSDAHSLQNLGREANVVAGQPSYDNVYQALVGRKNFIRTIEFFPEEGKYHYDGHRSCLVSLSPEEALNTHNLCPKCQKPLTIGVRHRVNELADRPFGFKPKKLTPFKSIVPLVKIIADVLGIGENSKKVQTIYNKIIQALGSEFEILLDTPPAKLLDFDNQLGSAIIKVRQGKVKLTAGYDGVYGQIKIKTGEKSAKQEKLF